MLTEYKFKLDIPYHWFPETVDAYFAKYKFEIVDCFTISDNLELIKTIGRVAKPNQLGYSYYDRDDDMCLWVQETKHGRTYRQKRWWTTNETLAKDMLAKELERYLAEITGLQQAIQTQLNNNKI